MAQSPPLHRPRLGAVIAMIGTLTACAPIQGQPAGELDLINVGRTLEVTPGYPRIHVQLRQGSQIVTGDPLTFGALQSLQGLESVESLEDLDALLQQAQAPARSFQAFLDTGASAYVISRTTAERFGLSREPGAVYHEVALHGETPMHVSTPYTIALADATGMLMDTGPGAAQHFKIVGRDVRLQLSAAAPRNPMIELAMGAIDVVGMPAIQRHVVEIDPAPLGATGRLLEAVTSVQGLAALEDGKLLDSLEHIGTGPAVTLHPADHRPPGVDLIVELDYVDFTRHENPRDRGPMPTLAPNPMVPNLVTEHRGKTFTGDWLLDTGAPASIISIEHAIALGLYDADGRPTQPPTFTLPLGGVAGQIERVPGYRIDALDVPTRDGRIIRYRDVSVLVTDISITMDDGRIVTLAGVFGTNLLMPTVAGMGGGLGLPTNVAAAPYRRVRIDGPRGLLLLELPEAAE